VKKFLLKYLKFFGVMVFCLQGHALEDVNFAESNGWDSTKDFNLDPSSPYKLEFEQITKLLSDNYNRLKPSVVKPASKALVPKILHYVWFGSKMPANYQYFLKTCRDHHPGWQIKIWNEEDILKENFENIDLYWRAQGYSERSDIARYEILRKYGGIYLDTDVECYKSFEDLIYLYDFFAGIITFNSAPFRIHLSNAIIGSAQNHPLFDDLFKNIRLNWLKNSDFFEAKYSISYNKYFSDKNWMAVNRTMLPLTEVVLNIIKNDTLKKYKVMALPSVHFFPYKTFRKKKDTLDILLFPLIKLINNEILEYYLDYVIDKNTLAFHYFGKENSLVKETNFINYKKADKNKYLVQFGNLFYNNYPTKLEYNSVAQIPEVLYILASSEDESIKLQLKQKWQNKNKFFNINIITDKDIDSILDKKWQNLSIDLKRNLVRFYLINQKGGVFVEDNVEPFYLREFSYKYSFFSRIDSADNANLLRIDTKILAARNNHSILRNFINQLEVQKSLDAQLIEKLFLDNCYHFYSLDGKTIFMTEDLIKQKRNIPA
jgi:hypothetical protein